MFGLFKPECKLPKKLKIKLTELLTNAKNIHLSIVLRNIYEY